MCIQDLQRIKVIHVPTRDALKAHFPECICHEITRPVSLGYSARFSLVSHFRLLYIAPHFSLVR